MACSIAVGLAAGLANASLIGLVQNYLAVGSANVVRAEWIFVGLCVLVPLTKIGAQLLFWSLVQKTVARFLLNMCRQIVATPLRRLEEIGTDRLLASLTDDISAITGGLAALPTVCINSAFVIGCLARLSQLSWPASLATGAYLATGWVTFRLATRRADQELFYAREEVDRLFSGLRSMTEGIKELKIHRERREAFFKESLESAVASFRRRHIKAIAWFGAAADCSQFQFLLLLGLLIFVALPSMGLQSKIIAGYVLVLLYMMGSADAIWASAAQLGQSKVALEKLEQLGVSLRVAPLEPEAAATPSNPHWQSLQLAGVTYRYNSEREQSFVLGPIDLSFVPGQITFITGGNGSGKTTLTKLITGLYEPDCGEMSLDQMLISRENRDQFRQQFSVVFSDSFLFQTLWGLRKEGLDVSAGNYLVQLQLEGKVRVQNGRLSTINLSKGQQKRLSLLAAYLEDRPVYVFDEWAADQDPEFRQVFYLKLLPELKQCGKAVIVISHDDRYFHVADQIIRLDEGKLTSLSVKSPPEHSSLDGEVMLANAVVSNSTDKGEVNAGR